MVTKAQAEEVAAAPARFTAAQARELAGPTVTESVDALLETIKKLAQEGKRRCRTGYDHTGSKHIWQDGGYNHTPDWQAACDQLRKLGYKVTFFYEERQFVDLYTLVEW